MKPQRPLQAFPECLGQEGSWLLRKETILFSQAKLPGSIPCPVGPSGGSGGILCVSCSPFCGLPLWGALGLQTAWPGPPGQPEGDCASRQRTQEDPKPGPCSLGG